LDHRESQLKNSILYLSLVVVKNLFPFLTIPILSRILTPDDYGVLALSMVYVIFIDGLANLGMTTGYDRNFFQYRNNYKEKSQLLFSIIIFVTSNYIIFGGLTYFFRNLLSNLIIGSPAHGNLLFFALCAQFFLGINIYYFSYLKNSENAKDFAFFTITMGLLRLILSLFFVAYLRMGVIGLIYADLYSALLIFCIFSYRFVKTISFSVNKKIFYESFKISYPLTPTIFIGVINSQFDKYMISLLSTVGGVGIYSISQRFSAISWTFMSALQNVFSPTIYKHMFDYKQDERSQFIGKYITPFIYISIFIALMVALFSEELISILTPKSYHGAINIVAILCIYYGISFFRKITGLQLVFKKKAYISMLESLIAVVLNICLNILLIMQYGAIGAALATLITGLIVVPIFFSIAQKFYKIKWEYRKILYIYSHFILFTILIIILRNLDVSYPLLITIKIIAVSIYLMIGIKLKVISNDNYLLVKSVLSKKNSL